MLNFKEKIIVAIDTIDTSEALRLVKTIPDAGALKLGLEYFCFNGPEGIKLISQTGAKIFLDLKFHDIPNTVAGAIKAILHLQPYMLTVHLSGGYDMLMKANDIVSEYCLKNAIKRPKILGVSVLTSLDDNDFSSLGIKGRVEDQVIRLAKLAEAADLDGLVSSARELKIIRKALGSKLILVTPGIRLMDGQVNDQKRIVTPSQAINDGANFLVIGRPITASKDPGASLEHIAKVI
jgi:orotidine-5'-phosphate decarboxylase|tara:strand:+ start:444 stop:1151 length:708 start_codon:yes stop_codon:yes gene_type:complete